MGISANDSQMLPNPFVNPHKLVNYFPVMLMSLISTLPYRRN